MTESKFKDIIADCLKNLGFKKKVGSGFVKDWRYLTFFLFTSLYMEICTIGTMDMM